MGSPDIRNIMHLDGYLCLNPTDVSTDFPHGGTAIGEMRDGEFRYGERERLIIAEEFGRVAVDGFRVMESPVLTAVLREWDDDALAAVFPDTTTGASGRVVIRGDVGTNGRRAGGLLSDLAVTLCFSPRSLDQHSFIILYSAIPVLRRTVHELRTDREIGTLVAFYGLPDASQRLYRVAHRSDVIL